MTDQKQKIIILTQYFTPEPVPFCHEFAKMLVADGYFVEVITSFPIYPMGKIYPGYKLCAKSSQIIDGVKITRLWQFPDHSLNVFKRALNYFSFAGSLFFYALSRKFNYDYIFAYQSALPASIVTILISKIKKLPLVSFVADIWPESLVSSGMINNKLILGGIDYFSRLVYKSSNLVVGVTPGYIKKFKMIGINDDKLHLTYYWPPDDIVNLIKHSSSNFHNSSVYVKNNERYNIVFAGNIGKSQSLTTVVDAAGLLAKKGVSIALNIVGDGTELEALRAYCLSSQIKNVYFHGRVSFSDVVEYLLSADILLVHLKSDDLTKITIPSKTWPYLLTGKPVLMAVEGVATDIVVDNAMGYVSTPENPESIVATVENILAESREDQKLKIKNGLEFFSKNVSKEVQYHKLVSRLSSL